MSDNQEFSKARWQKLAGILTEQVEPQTLKEERHWWDDEIEWIIAQSNKRQLNMFLRAYQKDTDAGDDILRTRSSKVVRQLTGGLKDKDWEDVLNVVEGLKEKLDNMDEGHPSIG